MAPFGFDASFGAGEERGLQEILCVGCLETVVDNLPTVYGFDHGLLASLLYATSQLVDAGALLGRGEDGL